MLTNVGHCDSGDIDVWVIVIVGICIVNCDSWGYRCMGHCDSGDINMSPCDGSRYV